MRHHNNKQGADTSAMTEKIGEETTCDSQGNLVCDTGESLKKKHTLKAVDTPAILIAMGVTLAICTLVALVLYVAPLVVEFMDVYVDAV